MGLIIIIIFFFFLIKYLYFNYKIIKKKNLIKNSINYLFLETHLNIIIKFIIIKLTNQNKYKNVLYILKKKKKKKKPNFKNNYNI